MQENYQTFEEVLKKSMNEKIIKGQRERQYFLFLFSDMYF